MKRSLIFSLISIALLLGIFCFDYKDKLVYAEQSINNFYSIESPIQILTINDNEWYVYQNNGTLIHFANNQYQTKQIEQAKDFKIIDNKLHYLQNNQIKTLEQTISSSIINAIGFCACNNALLTYNATTIKFGTLTNSSFIEIQDVYCYGNYIYVIDNCFLKKLNINNLELTTDSPTRLTWDNESKLKMKIINNNIFLLADNVLKTFDLDGKNSKSILEPTDNVVNRTFISGEVFKIGSFDIINEDFYIVDYITGAIQKFIYVEDSLIFEKLIVASYGADENRLYNPTSMCFTEFGIVIADNGNNRLVLNNKQLCELDSSPLIITSDNDKTLYIMSNTKISKYILSTQNNVITATEDSAIEKPTDLVDLYCSQTGELFALTHDKILRYDNELWSKLKDLVFNNITKFKGDASGQNIFIKYEQGISVYNINTDVITNIYQEYSIRDFALDYKNNLYILKSSIIKKISNNGQLVDTLQINNYAYISIELSSGDIYFLDLLLHRLDSIKDTTFTENLISFENDITYFNNTLLDNPANIADIKTECNAYKYPFTISPVASMSIGDKVIVLKDECNDNSEFSYCLITSNSAVNTLAYISKDNLNFEPTEIAPSFNQVKIITIAHVYKYPTSLDYEGITITKPMLQYNQIVELLNYCYGIQDSMGTKFYCVRLEDGKIGYINSRTAMNSQLDKYQKTFQPNGKLIKHIEEDKIFMYEQVGEQYVNTGKEFENGKLIFLANNIDTDLLYTKIAYQNENNEQVMAYVETKYVFLNDFTKHKYIGLALLIIAVIMGIIITSLVLVLKQNKYTK